MIGSDMKMGMQEGDPERKKLTTDPGIAPPRTSSGKDTDPGAAGADDAGALPAMVRVKGEQTPVPPEMTDGLLSGLIAGENEAYFRRAKAAPASNGDAAAAFHGGPSALGAGNPTPPPEPPVLLRRSVETEIVRASLPPPDGLRGDARDSNPAGARGHAKNKLEATVPNPAPRAPGMEMLTAFAVAALAAGLVAILVVRGVWGGSTNTAASSPPPAPLATAASQPQPASPPPSLPPPPAPVDTSPPVTPPVPAAIASAAPVTKPTVKTPAARAQGPRASPSASATSAPAVLPPPKDDVKRSM